jgi:acyl-CoA synthetase (AMP-forming)/AMP-acid ligase II
MFKAQHESHWISEDAPPLREKSIADLLDEAVELWPDREAIVYAGYEAIGLSTRWTFAQLADRAMSVAAALAASGIERGDRVAVWATNRPEWLLLQFGAAYAGVVLVPLNPLYRKAEITHVLHKAGAVACFLEPENRGVDLVSILEEAQHELPSLTLAVAIGNDDGHRIPAFDAWLSRGDEVAQSTVARRRRQVDPHDTAMILFTSGTTGFSKGAELHHFGLVNNAHLFARRAELIDGGRHCNPMPYFHCGGCAQATLGLLATGTTQLPTLTFDAKRIVSMIEQESVTSLSAVPTMIIALEEEADRAGASFASLQLVVTGASPIPVDVLRRWRERFGVRFTVTYGLTEASPVITQSLPSDPDSLQIATCGTPLPHYEVDVVRPGTRERVPIGEQGELRARGPMVMTGYWREPEATSAAIEDGWLRTGDLARIDTDGYVSIVGRAKDMIIRGGENIDPVEVENALRLLDGVIEASVVGCPDSLYGETVVAFVRVTGDSHSDPNEMKAVLQSKMARFKVPDRIYTVERFPLTPSGKIQKFKLREWLAANAEVPSERPVELVED